MYIEIHNEVRSELSLRIEDALETKPNIIATGCPYCKTMMTDGIKFKQKETQIIVKDIAELIAEANHL